MSFMSLVILLPQMALLRPPLPPSPWASPALSSTPQPLHILSVPIHVTREETDVWVRRNLRFLKCKVKNTEKVKRACTQANQIQGQVCGRATKSCQQALMKTRPLPHTPRGTLRRWDPSSSFRATSLHVNLYTQHGHPTFCFQRKMSPSSCLGN